MDSPVILRYPNKRKHATTVSIALEPGSEFELYGRRWRAVAFSAVDQRRAGFGSAMLCESLGKVLDGAARRA